MFYHHSIHGVRDSVPTCLLLRYAKISSKTSRVGSGVQGESSMYQVLKSKRFESHSTQQNIIFQHY